MSKRIFITGGSGFIGSRLMKNLGSENEYFILTRKKDFTVIKKNVKIITGALCDLSKVAQEIKTIDIIIHLAAEINDAKEMEETNVNGVKYLCEFARNCGVKKIIHLSSVGVFGVQYSPMYLKITENNECDPKNYYEETKLISEQILLKYADEYKTELVILRPTNVFGDGHPRRVLLQFIQRHVNGKRIPYCNNSLLNYVYVDDLVFIIKHIISNSMEKNIYIVGNATDYKLFSKFIFKSCSIMPRFIYLPLKLVKFLMFLSPRKMNRLVMKLRAISNYVDYDGSVIATELKINYNLTSGLEKTIEYYKSQGWLN